jgi:hypothetical protein
MWTRRKCHQNLVLNTGARTTARSGAFHMCVVTYRFFRMTTTNLRCRAYTWWTKTTSCPWCTAIQSLQRSLRRVGLYSTVRSWCTRKTVRSDTERVPDRTTTAAVKADKGFIGRLIFYTARRNVRTAAAAFAAVTRWSEVWLTNKRK